MEKFDSQTTLNDDCLGNLTDLFDNTNLNENADVVSTECIGSNNNHERKYFDKPNQPKLDFPQTNGRRFKESWYQQYSWLEYDVQKDAVFCFICMQISS